MQYIHAVRDNMTPHPRCLQQLQWLKEWGTCLGDVSKALDNEVQGLCGAAHAPQDEDLFPDQPPVLAQLEGCLQGVPLAAD